MLKMANTYGNTFTEVKMVHPSSSNNWLRTDAQVSGFIVLPIQAHVAPWITTPMWYSVNQVSPTYLPKINYQMTTSVSSGKQPKKFSHKPADFDHQYSFQFLEQLQGNFWDAGQNGGKLQIVLQGSGDKQCAIVRKACSAGEDRLIYDEDSRFTLCSMDDDVEAVMLKGGSSTQPLTWWRNDGKPMRWRRLIKNHENLETGTFSRAPKESLEQELSGESVCDHQDVLEPSEDSTDDVTNWSDSSETSIDNSSIDQNIIMEEPFDIFRTQCEDPVILQKVLDWGVSRTSNLKIGEKEIGELAAGHMWVSVRLSSKAQKNARKLSSVRDNLKGAYLEVTAGVYYQPAPKPNEPSIHRLRKLNGNWVIEAFDEEQRIWRARAKELQNGSWVDLPSGWKLYNVHVIPMVDIFNRMKHDLPEYEEMNKRIEFLFDTCNQKRLNTKLKSRSLKHHIYNLTVKLEKQHALNFALRVAGAADSIALKHFKVKTVESSKAD